MMKHTGKLLFLFLIVGFTLRLYHLDFQCMWTEEQYTLGMSTLPSIEIIFGFNTDRWKAFETYPGKDQLPEVQFEL